MIADKIFRVKIFDAPNFPQPDLELPELLEYLRFLVVPKNCQSSKMLLLPLAILLVQFVATALIVGFTPTSSTLRTGILPLLAICTWIEVSISRQCVGRGPWAAVAGGYSVTYLLQYISVALFDGRAFETRKMGTTFSRRLYDANVSDVNI